MRLLFLKFLRDFFDRSVTLEILRRVVEEGEDMGGGNEDGSRQGMRQYYTTKLRELEVIVQAKEANLKRLEAQRNELNGRGITTNEQTKNLFFLLFFPPPFFFGLSLHIA